MPRPPKKRNSPFSSRPPSPAPRGIVPHPGNIDRGLVRAEWKERLEQRAKERAQLERPGAQIPGRPGARPPGRPLRKRKSAWDKFWEPFMIFAPSPEEAEESRGQAERRARFHEAIVPEAEREYVRAQEEAWRRGERAFERGGPQAAYSARYQGAQRGQPAPVKPPPLEVTPGYITQVFDPDKMFAHVLEMKKDPRFKSHGGVGSVGVIAPAGIDDWGKVLKVAQFFGIPEANLSSFQRQEVWEKLIKPFLAEVERVLNSMKPSDIPGSFKFESAPSGAFGLIYSER